ncbi:MAG: C4-type zinc ribbon domain-containing protein [Candidatus Dormibacteraeota bacterium]|nr:C4-type zinc ribbon domain-containing protein [Candidatus Dormibacteraeota bacterium]
MSLDPTSALAGLYQTELELARIRKEITSTVAILEGNPAAGDLPRLAAAERRCDELRRLLRDAEQQERTERSRARTHEAQLYSGTIHNPRELSQLAGELEQLKGRLALEEVAEMELLTSLDDAEAELKAATEEAAEAQRTLKGQRGREANAAERVQQRRTEIDPSFLRLYDRVSAHRPPPAVAEVRNGTCTGCRLPLAPSQARALRMATQPLTCESCGRILLMQ